MKWLQQVPHLAGEIKLTRNSITHVLASPFVFGIGSCIFSRCREIPYLNWGEVTTGHYLPGRRIILPPGTLFTEEKAQGRCNEKRSALRRSRIWNPENDSLSCSMATYCGISHTLNFSFDSLFSSAVTTGQVSVRTTSAISFVLISLIEPSKVSFFPAVWQCNLSAFIWTAFEL